MSAAPLVKPSPCALVDLNRQQLLAVFLPGRQIGARRRHRFPLEVCRIRKLHDCQFSFARIALDQFIRQRLFLLARADPGSFVAVCHSRHLLSLKMRGIYPT